MEAGGPSSDILLAVPKAHGTNRGDNNVGLSDEQEIAAAPPSPSRSTYSPQFSKARYSWILSRARTAGAGASKTASQNEPPSDRNGEGSKVSSIVAGVAGSPASASTLPMPNSQPPGLWERSMSGMSEVARRYIPSYSPDLKRKRASDEADIDFSQSTIPFKVPARCAPASIIGASVAPPVSGSHGCSKCGVQTSTAQNALVVCHGCLKPFHQHCLSWTDPSENVASRPGTFCQDCLTKSGEQSGGASGESQDRQFIVEKIRRRRLANLPTGVIPAKPELVGFLARQASGAERTEYFLGKKRTELLNILSLCDQLKPQLLVDILVSVSKKHPDLPIFDDPEWRENLPGATAAAAAAAAAPSRPRVTAGAKPRARHGHTLLHPKAGTHKVKGSRKVLKRITVVRPKKEPGLGGTAPPTARPEAAGAGGQDAAAGEAGGGEGEEEVVAEEEEMDALPPTWPKAGEGLYAKLPPESEDRLLLEDDNDEEAFSHFMVDKGGKQMVAVVPACA
ncbi:hypothetical protein JDV02_007172 [Purpureocillium takamizusanense]|uniref:PHD-type domain-containing protein n=1 Tax=Purpureocillium takamizusanense TaxID=2060973 RepID=A0A9Q8QMG2_9HYPO|nr:uncharacterized protein JDV02_007172 [Purpureocillium takamizusanense]UNI21157.1 hypothetical protein JDV02_007172 [Purpureocillium takamizusanense]